MIVRSICISRDGDWGQPSIDLTKPMRAVIKVQGQNGNIELNLSDKLSAGIIAIIAEEVAAAGKATAEAMTAEILTQASLPAPEKAD